MVLDDEVGEGGGEAGLDGKRPGAGGAERGEEAAKAAGGVVLRQAGHRRPRPSPASIGGRRGRLIGRGGEGVLGFSVRFGAASSLGWLPWVAEFVSAFGACGEETVGEDRKGREARPRASASGVSVLRLIQLFFVLFLHIFWALEKNNK